jgi:hypothetical protein
LVAGLAADQVVQPAGGPEVVAAAAAAQVP